MHVHYICRYGELEENRNLAYSPAGVAKMKYIIDTLKGMGCTVTVYSTCCTKNGLGCFYNRKIIEIDKQQTVILSFTFGIKSKSRLKSYVMQRLERFTNKCQLLFYLLFKVKQKDIVMVYHEMYYLPIMRFVKMFKRIALVYEVEELYTAVANRSDKELQTEVAELSMADAYICSNDIMARKYGFDSKPYVVAYGAYRMEPVYSGNMKDGKIHVVYAGTLSSEKGGAIAVVAAAEFLPRNYHIHILGFGTECQINSILRTVSEITTKSACTVTYDGCLSGEEYLQFLQKCDIGLSTQRPDALFNDTSFPSKVLSYLANGLHVVSVKIKALEKSKINALLYYYTENTPEAIAKAIMQVKLADEYDSRAYIMKLDERFCKALKKTLNLAAGNKLPKTLH